ncbi:hypothetical protein ABXS75_00950 [Roseburia hominis]
MVFINDSLTIVLVGDWNKLYIQPDWVANNVFEKEEIEIGINGQGSDFAVSYRENGVVVSPGQSKVVFSVINTDDETLNKLCQCINNFVEKAYTPQLFAYGLNADFLEEEGILFAEVIDSMSDTRDIVENGYEVVSTKISRTLKRDDKFINMDCNLENKNLMVHFNEHHNPGENKPNFCIDDIKNFIEESCGILRGLGYEIEGDE